ncbi:hypothetical protein JAAARDRAFT_49391 [Jaapia argillacea MUCL 33604]|uniref:Ubiquitin-like protease family profile domain-containing protein n=1 Tax=Jaapia argillacea MUCL 33604 TaxID=933084 RepID=A0A067PT46_9AGAM|nr:hypothetical protein JAAARDRAFT_49391 [Jaapia argillacea MUCL 33604]
MGPTEPTLDYHLWQIHNIQYDRTNLQTLLPGACQKIPGAIVNAFGALLQDAHEKEQTGDFCVFSSRLTLIVDGHVPDNGPGGSFKDLVMSAWCIPLCSGLPAHWVLGWVDFGSREIGIYDSVPELGSSYWAELMLLRVIDRIREFIKSPKIEWGVEKWKRTLCSPVELERQLDSWSCGLFVMMALKSFADNLDHCQYVRDSLKGDIQAGALQALLNGWIIRESRPPMEVAEPETATIHLDESDEGSTELRTDMDVGELNSQGGHDTMAMVDVSTSEFKDHLTDEEGSKGKRAKAACGPRKRCKTLVERKEALENDSWTKTVEPHRICCEGCNKWYDLNAKREYDATNWMQHRAKCPRITGIEVKRIAVKGMKQGRKFRVEKGRL